MVGWSQIPFLRVEGRRRGDEVTKPPARQERTEDWVLPGIIKASNDVKDTGVHAAFEGTLRVPGPAEQRALCSRRGGWVCVDPWPWVSHPPHPVFPILGQEFSLFSKYMPSTSPLSGPGTQARPLQAPGRWGPGQLSLQLGPRGPAESGELGGRARTGRGEPLGVT